MGHIEQQLRLGCMSAFLGLPQRQLSVDEDLTVDVFFALRAGAIPRQVKGDDIRGPGSSEVIHMGLGHLLIPNHVDVDSQPASFAGEDGLLQLMRLLRVENDSGM